MFDMCNNYSGGYDAGYMPALPPELPCELIDSPVIAQLNGITKKAKNGHRTTLKDAFKPP